MYLDFLFYLSYFFISLFVIVLLIRQRHFLKRCWEIAKIKGKNNKQKQDFIKEQESKGLKPFKFDNGNTVIYAKNGNMALADYKKLQDKQKQAIRTLKKVK